MNCSLGNDRLDTIARAPSSAECRPIQPPEMDCYGLNYDEGLSCAKTSTCRGRHAVRRHDTTDRAEQLLLIAPPDMVSV